MKSQTEINLEEIILKYWPQVKFRVQESLGKHSPDWEDVAAEILIDAITSLREGKFKGESSVGTFIYVITSRRIIDYIRTKAKTLTDAPEPATLPDPLVSLEKKRQADLVAKSLKKLSSKQADIIYLYYYFGLSRDEIAQAYGVSPSRVSEIMEKAKKVLKKILS